MAHLEKVLDRLNFYECVEWKHLPTCNYYMFVHSVTALTQYHY